MSTPCCASDLCSRCSWRGTKPWRHRCFCIAPRAGLHDLKHKPGTDARNDVTDRPRRGANGIATRLPVTLRRTTTKQRSGRQLGLGADLYNPKSRRGLVPDQAPPAPSSTTRGSWPALRVPVHRILSGLCFLAKCYDRGRMMRAFEIPPPAPQPFDNPHRLRHGRPWCVDTGRSTHQAAPKAKGPMSIHSLTLVLLFWCARKDSNLRPPSS